jgi:ribosomal protein S18 acetylase RimI-like enzyme
MFKIRRFINNDAIELAELDKLWVKEGISPGMAGARTANEFIKDCKTSICFVGLHDNNIVGYVLGEKNKDYIELDSLYVLKKYRSTGIGAKLVIKLISDSKKQGFKSIKLVADSKKQKLLISFYEKLGFKKKGLYKNKYPVLVKVLSP